jgi:hypothetical protein
MIVEADLIDVRGLSRLLNAPLHRINYCLLAHSIRPVRRIGLIRLFDAEAIEKVRQALNERS